MADISTWSNTAANNSSGSPDGFPEGMNPSGVNNASREVMAAVRRQHEDAEWLDFGDTPTYVSTTSFTVAGDLTSRYNVGRKIRLTDATTINGVITASSYSSPNTTITVAADGNLSVSLTAFAVGLISGSNALPNKIPKDYDTLALAVADIANISIGDVIESSRNGAYGTWDCVGYSAPDGFSTVDGDGSTKMFQLRVRDAGANVKQYGAAGDGTDATDEIESITEERIYFPEGTYLCNGLTFSTQKELILHPAATIKLANAQNVPVVTLNGAGSSIKGGIIDGNKANQSVQADGISIGADNCIIEGVTLNNVYSYGITSQAASGCLIKENRITDNGWTGIFFKANSANEDNNKFIDNYIDRSGEGTGVTGGGMKIIGDDSSYSQQKAIIRGNNVIMPTTPTSVAAICIEVFGLAPQSIVQGNTTEGGEMGISIDNSTYVSCTGNTIQDAETYGIEIPDSGYCSIVGNTIDGIAGRGIATTGATGITNNTIANNVISGCDTNPIYLSAGSDHTAISGNTIENKTAINFVDIHLNQSDYCSVTGNVINGNTTTSQVIRLERSNYASIVGNTALNKTGGFVQLQATASHTFQEIVVSGNVSTNCGTPLTSSGAGVTLAGNIMMLGHVDANINYEYLDFANDVKRVVRTGTPEGNDTAGIGSTCHNYGPASTEYGNYVKSSGTGNTGWAGIGTVTP